MSKKIILILVFVSLFSISILLNNNIITIPAGDGNRANIFGDPLLGTLKSIFIVNNYNTTEYKDDVNIKINIINNNIMI